MKYIQRNGTGEAISVYANLQAGYAEEAVSDYYIRPPTLAEIQEKLKSEEPSRIEILEAALVAKGTLTVKSIEDAKTALKLK